MRKIRTRMSIPQQIQEVDLEDLISVHYEQDEDDLRDGIITIHSDIDEGLWEGVLIPLRRLESSPKIEEITIYLSTSGGTMCDALTFCDMVDRLAKKTTLILFGEVLSCGMIMACSGYHNPNVHTVCYPSVIGMLHRPFFYRYADEQVTTRALEEMSDILGQRETMMKDYIMSHSTLTPEVWDVMMTKDYYMNAEDLLKFGIVDEIL